MKAMIFAAGLGTRLRPLTNDKPKALVHLAGVPLMERVAQRLIGAGVEELVVNVHHFAPKVIEHLAERDNYGITVRVSDESDLLLETGGGLKKAGPLLAGDAPFFVHNADVFTDLNLVDLYQHQLANGALATLAVRQRETSRYLLFDPYGVLCGWENLNTGEVKIVRGNGKSLCRRAFSGIQVISPEIFPRMRHKGKFSIIDTYLDLARDHEILAYPHDEGYWIDCGKPAQLAQAEELLVQKESE